VTTRTPEAPSPPHGQVPNDREQRQEPIRILVVEPQQILANGLQVLLDGSNEFKVVGCVRCGRDVVGAAKALRAEIVVLDDALPDITATEVIRRLHCDSPDCRVLALSSDALWADVVGLFRAGAWGFVTKERSFDDLKAGLRDIALGNRFVDGHTGGLLASTWGDVPGTATEISLASLSKREREVFRLAIEGKNASEIAKLLFICQKTAEKHRRVVLHKLKVRNTAELVKFAARNRFLSP